MKFLSTPFIISTLSLVHITYGNVKGEISIKSATEVTVALQKLFRSGCVYVLQTEEETISGNKWFQHSSPMVVVL
jgi:transcriptional regulator of NAD metabolism